MFKNGKETKTKARSWRARKIVPSAVGDFNYKFCSPNYAMKHKTSQPFLLHKHGVISCAIAKGGALRERGYVRTHVVNGMRLAMK